MRIYAPPSKDKRIILEFEEGRQYLNKRFTHILKRKKGGITECLQVERILENISFNSPKNKEKETKKVFVSASGQNS